MRSRVRVPSAPPILTMLRVAHQGLVRSESGPVRLAPLENRDMTSRRRKRKRLLSPVRKPSYVSFWRESRARVESVATAISFWARLRFSVAAQSPVARREAEGFQRFVVTGYCCHPPPRAL